MLFDSAGVSIFLIPSLSSLYPMELPNFLSPTNSVVLTKLEE